MGVEHLPLQPYQYYMLKKVSLIRECISFLVGLPKGKALCMSLDESNTERKLHNRVEVQTLFNNNGVYCYEHLQFQSQANRTNNRRAGIELKFL